ncbi:hypothetical protein H6G81_22020, partial [Scytonema hofmannii FACHB-248]|nr:hypothetical protein [Scytonema hofmannii FACHB-248]
GSAIAFVILGKCDRICYFGEVRSHLLFWGSAIAFMMLWKCDRIFNVEKVRSHL